MTLRRLALLFLLACGPPLLAQTTGTGPITLSAANQCAGIDASGQATVSIDVSGTFSLTLQPSVSIHGGTARNVQVTPANSTTPQSTITTANLYKADVAATEFFQVCVSSYVSGSAVVNFKQAPQISAKLLGGGTTYTGTNPIVVSGSAISCPTCGTGSGNVTTTPVAGQFITNITPTTAASGFGAGSAACSAFDTNGTTDMGCAAATNLYTFLATGSTSFDHGWNYYFQSDMTQTTTPTYGLGIAAIAEIPASGQVVTDFSGQEAVTTVSGGNASINGMNIRGYKSRSFIAGSGTVLNGNMYGFNWYLPNVGAGATMNGILGGYYCDNPTYAGTMNGIATCITGGGSSSNVVFFSTSHKASTGASYAVNDPDPQALCDGAQGGSGTAASPSTWTNHGCIGLSGTTVTLPGATNGVSYTASGAIPVNSGNTVLASTEYVSTQQPTVDCSDPQYNSGGTQTWDAILAACIASKAGLTSYTYDMRRLGGTQTIATNPMQTQVGYGGFSPVQGGNVLVAPGNYTQDQDLILTSGWSWTCIAPHSGGPASTMGCNLIAAMPGIYQTGTVTNTAVSCPGGGQPCTATFTAGGGATWTANQVGEQIAVCTAIRVGTIGCSSFTAGAATAQGTIQSITSTTATVLINNGTSEGNANATGVKYAIFPTPVALGDGSCSSTGICGNFNVHFGGFTVDMVTNAVSGAYGFFNRSASNQTGIGDVNAWIPYDGACGYIGGSGATLSAYVSPISNWCLSGTGGGNTTQHTVQGLLIRDGNNKQPPSWLANWQVALGGAKNGASVSGIDTCAYCIGSKMFLGPALKAITSTVTNTTSWGIQVNAGIICSVVCLDPEGDSSGLTIMDFDSASIGAGAIQLSNVTATLHNVNVFSVKDINNPASGIANLVSDVQNSVNVPYNDESTNTLGWYQLDANGKSHTSAACSGCNTYILPAAQGGTGTSTPFATNAQTATYQMVAADFSSYKTIPVASGTFTITVVASGSQPPDGQFAWVLNYGTGVVTIARSGQNLNGGTTSILIPPGTATSPSGALIRSDSTNYEVIVFPGMSMAGVDNSSGSTTAYVVNGTGITSLTAAGAVGCWQALNANTTATPTINFNGLGAKTVTKISGGPVTAGDIGTSSPTCFQYNGTTMNLLNPQAKTGTGSWVLSNAPSFTGGITVGGTDTLNGTVGTYNSIATVNNGIPSELATVDSSLSAAVTATTIYTPAATGRFRVSANLIITTPAASSSILGGTTGVVISYTDGISSVAQSVTCYPTNQSGVAIVIGTGNTGNTTTSQYNCAPLYIYAKTGVAIQYAIGYTSVGGTAMVYEAHLLVESM
jgi:autotransporter-associated beta strand protein